MNNQSTGSGHMNWLWAGDPPPLCHICGGYHWGSCPTTTWTNTCAFDSAQLNRIEKMARIASANGEMFGLIHFFLEEGYFVYIKADPYRAENKYTVIINNKRVSDTDDPVGLLRRMYRSYCIHKWGFDPKEAA